MLGGEAAKPIEQLNAAEGGLHIENPDPETRARYRRALDRPKRDGPVPAGKSLWHTGRSSGALIIQLIDPANGGETEWNRTPDSAGTEVASARWTGARFRVACRRTRSSKCSKARSACPPEYRDKAEVCKGLGLRLR